jgi:hypothetical protein
MLRVRDTETGAEDVIRESAIREKFMALIDRGYPVDAPGGWLHIRLFQDALLLTRIEQAIGDPVSFPSLLSDTGESREVYLEDAQMPERNYYLSYWGAFVRKGAREARRVAAGEKHPYDLGLPPTFE